MHNGCTTLGGIHTIFYVTIGMANLTKVEATHTKVGKHLPEILELSIKQTNIIFLPNFSLLNSEVKQSEPEQYERFKVQYKFVKFYRP